MENYRKCRTEAFPPVCPFSDLPPDTPQVQVKDGSKIRNLLRFALSRLLPCGHIVFTATGKGVSKAITCAEIMKRRVKGLHQLTRLLYATVSEVWEPLKPAAGLDSLSVSRKVPAVWILLCREAPDRSQPGYQAPGCYNALWTQPSNREEGGALTEPKAGNKRKRGGGGGGGGGRGRGRSLSGRSRDTMKGQNR
uniref:Ribonuclease P/MRP 25 subunit-like n=1 Tax=Takifugu rubripes TaxID=31033 RepID=H2U5N2_TAKRU